MIAVTKLKDYLKAYIQETRIPATEDELEDYAYYVPVMLDDKEVGVLGIDTVPSEILGQIAVLKLIYIQPEARGDFKSVVATVLQTLQNYGFKHIEIHANKKVSRWFRHYGNNYPITYIHFAEIDTILDNIKNPKTPKQEKED